MSVKSTKFLVWYYQCHEPYERIFYTKIAPYSLNRQSRLSDFANLYETSRKELERRAEIKLRVRKQNQEYRVIS